MLAAKRAAIPFLPTDENGRRRTSTPSRISRRGYLTEPSLDQPRLDV